MILDDNPIGHEVGVLTSEHRDTWGKVYQELIQGFTKKSLLNRFKEHDFQIQQTAIRSREYNLLCFWYVWTDLCRDLKKKIDKPQPENSSYMAEAALEMPEIVGSTKPYK